MSFKEFIESQFEVRIISEGKFKGWICFRTPLADYRISQTDWETIKNKINEV